MFTAYKLRRAGMVAIFIGTVISSYSCDANKDKAAQFPIRVMSFNIRYNTPADSANAWPHRKDMVATTIQFHRVDLLGVQEALKDQIDDLTPRLPEYDWIGAGRDDGKAAGEYSAIFYRREALAVLQHDTFWLSETPEKPGSLGWDAACPRIVTWAKFKSKNTGKIFYHFNTHFDHAGETARQKSAKMLFTRAAEISKSAPLIITGDLNAKPRSRVYEILTAQITEDKTQTLSPLLFDARYISALPHHGPDWTFHGFDAIDDRPRIDYIFVTKQIKVERHGILADRWNDRYPSDHLPVLAEIILE